MFVCKKLSLLCAASVAVLSLTGCGGDGVDATADPQVAEKSQAAKVLAVKIGNNHGHVLATDADTLLAAQGAQSVSLGGTANHVHRVAITAAELSQLQEGKAVSFVSSPATDAVTGLPHTHSVRMRIVDDE